VAWSKPNPMPESLSGWRWEQCKAKVKAGKLHHAYPDSEGYWLSQTYYHPPVEADGLTAQWQDCTGCPKCAANDGLVLRRGSWRPTSSHEYVFMLAKSSTYFSDGEAVREGRSLNGDNPAGRNLRSVWNIATQPYPGAHYATFPTALAQRCVLASTSRHACAECGVPWARVVESNRLSRPELPKDDPRYRPNTYQSEYGNINGKADVGYTTTKTLDHRPSCGCGAGVRPCIVLDPFCGSGTVGQVCRELPFKRDFVGVDISYPYLHDQALVRSERRTSPDRLAELPMWSGAD